ncbi:MAG: hypothetical protein H7329_11715, partial [Opitutaceae bacterium]|nr:hypothetical protein [Cytophagales bacterium]
MNRLTRILALITMLAGYQPSLYAQRQTQNSFRSHFGPNALVGYYGYVPADYATNSGKSYPILIYLHGSGDKAWNPSDLSKLPFVKRNGPPFLIEGGQDFPFIVISPQCPFPSWDNVTTDNFSTFQTKPGEFVDEILEKMKTIYRIDLNRIYITGISMGGASAWEYTQLYPQKIAASIPIAGWSTGSKVCNIAASKVAVWTFQGELDGGAGISGLVNKINSCVPAPSPLAKATVYKGVGNDAWTQTYNNSGPGIAPDNIYEWLLRQSKSLTVNKAPVVNAGADLSYTLSTNTLTGDSLRIIGSATDDLHVSSVLWTQISGPFVTLKNTNQQTLTLKGLKAGTYILRLTAKDDAGLTAFDEVNLIVNPAQVIIAKQIVDKSDWKLKAEKAIVIDHDTSLTKTLTTGVDYNLENTLPANSTETISVKLPVLTDAGMFTFSFKGSIAGIQVNTYQSGDGVTWQPIQLGAYTNGRGDDLQKADIPLSVSNKWFRISFVNTTSTAA